MENKIDHLVYAVTDLTAACDHFEALLGVRPIFGGRHLAEGTKNALLNLGNKCYLELLAADEGNAAVPPPRWMGTDFLTSPKITRWAIKSNVLLDEAQVLKKHKKDLGKIKKGQRKLDNGKMLEWQLTMPLPEPEVEAVPFFIDWGNYGRHPTDNLPGGCKLSALKICHPQPDVLNVVFNELGIDLKIEKSYSPKITAILDSPKGRFEI